ncbi:hypothetical protein PsalN5692_03777 (plasmid) [Piscirickettsia salmonis]|uniref:hypothetical protein n=1 Tax=Piscirickettsia salmonis TaxID=1238 RepID=UPI0011CDDCD8|nr:hypothetical protein [Piscirickettsia salmonis]QGP52269.1 hypothetical protein PsalN5692_03777 [Piscirickettsia salmonis]
MQELIQTNYSLTNAQLVVIKAIHNLTTNQIAEITGHKPRTIAKWLCNPSTDNYRRAPDEAVRKLREIYSLEFR